MLKALLLLFGLSNDQYVMGMQSINSKECKHELHGVIDEKQKGKYCDSWCMSCAATNEFKWMFQYWKRVA